MKQEKGILPIFIALIVVGSLGLVGGSYSGVRYYQSVKYSKEADRLFDNGQYREAIQMYEKSLSRWKMENIENKRNNAEKENNFIAILDEGKNAKDQSSWEGCTEKLNNITTDSKSYSEAQSLASECKAKVDEIAAKKKADEESAATAAATVIAEKPATQSTRKETASVSTPVSNTPTSTQSSPPASTPTPTDDSSSSCQSNTNPSFTAHVTDLSKVTSIAIPPRIIGGDLKAHSYINSEHQRVPVYAPAAMKMIGGVHLSHGDDPSDYGMDWQISCEVKIRIGHITEPVQAIKDLLGAPVADSRNGKFFNPPTLSVAAGELIGYTTGTAAAGNWDFGVYNSSTSNRYASDPDWNWSTIYTTAVCPYNYYSSGFKSSYTSKYIQDFGVSTLDGPFFCQ